MIEWFEYALIDFWDDMVGSHSDKKDIMAQHVLVSIAQFGVRSII